MAKSWLDESGLKEFGQQLGTGGPIGALIGAGLALIGLFTGAISGTMALLLVPLAALAGGVAGDYIKKDGMVFGDHGVVKALENHSKPKVIPEGYVAISPNSDNYAATSAIIAKTGHVHSKGTKTMSPTEIMLGYQEYRALDPFIEFDLNNDQRLPPLRDKAREYGKRYASKDSKEYIADVHEREEKITKLIVADVYETYGSYGYGTLSDSKGNSAEYEAIHHPKRMLLGGKSVDFGEMKKGELVCRHYAPIMSVLLYDAQVPNHMVSSNICLIENKGGNYLFEEKYINGLLTKSGWDPNWKHAISPHAYVITDEGNAIVEGTTAGLGDVHISPEKRIRKPYVRIANGVTVQDIILRGKTAIPDIPEGYMQMGYGGQDITMDGKPNTFAVDEKVTRENVAAYDAQLKAQKKAKESVDQDITVSKPAEVSSIDPFVPLIIATTAPQDKHPPGIKNSGNFVA